LIPIMVQLSSINLPKTMLLIMDSRCRQLSIMEFGTRATTGWESIIEGISTANGFIWMSSLDSIFLSSGLSEEPHLLTFSLKSYLVDKKRPPEGGLYAFL